MSFIVNDNSPSNKKIEEKRRRSYRGLVLIIVILLLSFVVGYSGLLQKAGKTATYLFRLYIEAEQEKLRASGFVNEQGQPEYVVSLVEEEFSRGRLLLASLPGVVDVRNTAFDGWFVVSLEAGNESIINTVKNSSFVEFALPNRGVWFCH